MASNPKDKVYLTEAQLATIAGGGSITSGDDTYTADENTQYFTPDTSVSYEAQTLTAEQQAQARQNIGAGTSSQSVNDATLTIQKNGTTVDTFTANASVDKTINITVPTSASDVSALPDSTKYGATLELSINSTTYVVTATLKDQDGNTLGTAQTIDLPLESVVVSGSYDSANKKVVLTLQSGSTIEFSVADLVSGLQTELSASNKLNADYIQDGTTNKVFTATEKTKLSGIASGAEVNVQANWNESDSSSDAYIQNKPTIPTVNNGTLTIQKNGTQVATFTANQSGNSTANITVPTQASDIGAQPTIDASHKLSADLVADGTTNKVFTATEKTKLSNLYPIGSIYTSMNNTSPASLFGGTWASLPEGYFLQTLSNTTTITSDNISGTAVAPNDANANTTRKISSGLPDIAGDFKAAGSQAGIDGYAGAFYAGSSGSQIVQPANGNSNRAKFLASKGEIHSGSYSNNVYGKSEVVQPQSIKVYMWRRTA